MLVFPGSTTTGKNVVRADIQKSLTHAFYRKRNAEYISDVYDAPRCLQFQSSDPKLGTLKI